MEAWNSPPRVDVADVLRIESGIIGSTFTVVLSFTGNGKVLGRYEAKTDEEVDAILDTIAEVLASTAEAPAVPVPEAAPPRSPYGNPDTSVQERAEWVKSGGHLGWVWNEPERQWYEVGTLGGKGVEAYAAPASNVVDITTGVRSYRLSNGSEPARDWLRGVWGYLGTLPSQKPAKVVPFATIQQEKPSRPTTNEALNGFDLPRKSATISKRSPAEGVIEFEVRVRVDERDPVSSQDGGKLVNDALDRGDEALRATKDTYFDNNEIRRATCETSLFTGDCIWTGTLRGEMDENLLDDSNAVNYRRFLDATAEAEAAMFESLESEQIDVVQSWIVQMQTPWGKELHAMIQAKKEADKAKANAEKAEKAKEKAARKAAAPALDPEHDRPRNTSDTLPSPALVGRIGDMLVARGLPVGQSAKAIAAAIQTGHYSDILDTSNRNSRAIFAELTGVKLPSTIKGTKELFVGKPFSVQAAQPSEQNDANRIARFGVDIRGITLSMGTIPVVSVFYNKTRSVKEYARFADSMENAGFWLVEATTQPWPMDVHFDGNLSRNLSDSEWKMLDEIVAHGLPEKMAKEYRNGLKRYEALRAEIGT